MARTRTFDEADIRALLLRRFHGHGFDGSALPDLETATGLTRKSLYNAFGDKKAMFVQALKDFRRCVVAELTSPLREPEAGLAQIEAMLFSLVEADDVPDGRYGCLVCNTAREEIRDDPTVQAEIDGYFRKLEADFLAAVERGQARGEINGRPARDLARLCVSAVASLSLLGKAGQPVEVLRSIAAQTVESLR
ncbi:MAG: TetR/AcrR family transcriptional regulator [Pseudomonadota bacterium]